MAQEIAVKELPAQPIVGKRFRTSIAKIQDEIGAAFDALFAYLGEMGEHPGGMPFALYFGPDFDPNDFEMEVCVPVSRVLEGRGDIESEELPGGLAISTIHKGPYGEMETTYAEMEAWRKENGYEVAGPYREVYLNDPNQVGEANLLTEILIPVSK